VAGEEIIGTVTLVRSPHCRQRYTSSCGVQQRLSPSPCRPPDPGPTLPPAGLGVVVFAAFAYKLYFGVAPWESRPRPLPDVVGGGKLYPPQGTGSIGPGEITVIDGDTLKSARSHHPPGRVRHG